MEIIKTKIKDIVNDDLFSFKPDVEILDSDTIESITRLDPIMNKNVMEYHREIDWRAKTTKGALTKRIKSYTYRKHKVKLSPIILEKIGSIAASKTTATKEYALDITKEFNWKAGDFGDSGSCFFGGRTGIRIDMMDDGRYEALRFFVKDILGKKQGVNKYYDSYAGIGRSWIWKTRIQETINENKAILSDVYVVFNGYGPDTRWQASFLSAYLKLPMKRINVHNKGNVTGGLYVNNGIGYILGDATVIKKVTNLDFGLDVHHCSLQ